MSVTAQNMLEYMAKVELVREAFGRLGRGAQQEAAFDIRVSPSLVSSILKGRYVDTERLAQLAEWVEQHMSPVPSPEEAPAAASGN